MIGTMDIKWDLCDLNTINVDSKQQVSPTLQLIYILPKEKIKVAMFCDYDMCSNKRMILKVITFKQRKYG